MFKAFLSFLLFAFIVANNSYGQNSLKNSSKLKKQNNLEIELEQVNKKALLQQELLVKSNHELESAKQDLNNIGTKIKEKHLSLDKIRKHIKRLDSSIHEVNGAILIHKSKLAILKENYGSRLRSMYKLTKSSASIDFFVDSKSLLDLEKRRTFLSKIAKEDRKLIIAVTSAVADLEKSFAKLDELRERREESLSNLTLLLEELNSDKANKNIYINEKAQSAQAIKTIIAKLKKSAQQLEVSIEKIFTKSQFKSAFRLGKESLIFPLQAEVVNFFGKRKHKEFKDFVFSKGIELEPILDYKVKSVAPGVVILNKDLPGYGKVLIVDHGGRIYSLYGRINENLVNLGQNVETGQYLANASKKEPLYFELRKKGKAVNPISYFISSPG